MHGLHDLPVTAIMQLLNIPGDGGWQSLSVSLADTREDGSEGCADKVYGGLHCPAGHHGGVIRGDGPVRPLG